MPAGATIVITFPAEFVLSGMETCSSVFIDGTVAPGFTFVVSQGSRTVTINGAINAPLFVNFFSLTIDNVMNPSPALMTSSFLVSIGNDESLPDPSGTVALDPATFQSVTYTFNPTTVNTTGNLIVTATLQNTVNASSYIVLTFPTTLRWNQEIWNVRTLPIAGNMSCSALSSVLVC